MMKKIIPLLLLILLAFIYTEVDEVPGPGSQPAEQAASETVLQRAYRDRLSDVQVKGEGEVIRLLADDLDGSRHQKFIIRVDNKLTLLVSHNIDLAPRIDNLQKGDRIEFFGEYEWSNKGGVIHWTHHDPAGRHVDGWIRHKGRSYQ